MMQDLLSSIRGVRRRPLQPALAICILALGLSASVAVFTYINGFYRSFPGADTDGLVRVFGVEAENPYLDLSYLDYLDYAGRDGAFEGLAAAQAGYAASVRLETMTEVAFLEAVSGSYFPVLDIGLSLGRGLMPDDDRPGARPVAVISHAWWQRSFDGDRSVIGSVVHLNFRPFTIVGVAAPDFLGSTSGFRPDVWIPFAPFRDRYVSWAARAEDRDVPLVRVYGRLRPGLRRERAQAELAAVAAVLDRDYPRRSSLRRVRVEDATWIDPRARMAERTTVRLMMAAAIGLLLLVCANVANLLLSMATSRQREMATRAAVGASPSRLVRQVLIENVLLSSVAGAIALALAVPASARLGSYFARPSVWGANVPREAAVDGRVVAFAIAIAVVTGLVAGVFPALRASARSLVSTLRSGEQSAIPGRIGRWRVPGVHDLLVMTQVALAVVLLVVAGLVLRTLTTAGNLDPGFRYDRLLVTHVSTSSTELEPGDRARFFRELAEAVAREPWVRAATVADFPPLSPHPSAPLRVEGSSEPVTTVYSKIVPGFFDAMGIEVLEGRGFISGDTAGAPDVAMVNERLATRFFGRESAIGRRIWWPGADGGEDRDFEIVGLVRDAKFGDFFSEPEAMVFFSYPQHDYPTGSALLVVTAGSPAASTTALYRVLRGIEPHLAIVNVVPYTEVVRGFLYTQRMNAELFSVLGIVGMGLAAVGIFSVMNLAVGRRTREIGIRMSVGAERIDIGRLVFRKALGPVAAGLGLGLVLSFALTGLVRGLLFGVEPTDPLTLIAGTGVLLAAAAAAAWLPARRAVSIDPVTALRSDG